MITIKHKNNMADFIIPIDAKIKDFKIHLDSHPRTILSAKFGDGKSYFLNELSKDESVSNDYAFITIHPVNYQILDNKDILDLIKRDILAQMLINNMIEPQYDISKEELLYYYIRSNGNGLALFENIFEIISQLGFETNLISAFMAGVKSVKLINSIRKEIVRIKDESDIVSEIDKFIEKVDCSSKIYEEDIYTKIIKDNINYFRNEFNKKIVLVVEDMDRLDPAHLFRIMNVFSAHLDYCYNYGGKEQNLCDNKFNFDNIVFVLDYENTKKIYEHFYGVSTDFEGYIHKFSSKGYYKYSLKEIKEEYMSRIYSLLSDTTDMEIELIKELVPAKAIEENTIRKIEQACHNVDSQIYSQKKIVFNEKEYTLHLGILRLLVILARLGCSKDEVVKPMLNVCKTNFSDYSKGKFAKLFFSYSLGYLYIVDNMELSNVFYYNYSVKDYFRGVKILDINNDGIACIWDSTSENRLEGKKLLNTSIEKLFNLIGH